MKLEISTNELKKRQDDFCQKHAENSIDVNGFLVTSEGLVFCQKTYTYHCRLPKQHLAIIYKMKTTPRKVFTRQELLDIGWIDRSSERLEANVVMAISNIRLQFGNGCIITVRGLGYMSNMHNTCSSR